jgi:hypothetical protein
VTLAQLLSFTSGLNPPEAAMGNACNTTGTKPYDHWFRTNENLLKPTNPLFSRFDKKYFKIIQK